MKYSSNQELMINQNVICDRIDNSIGNNVSTSTQQIIFIDSQIEDYQFLATGTLPGIEVVILDQNSDGIEQITQVLKQKSNFTSIHIVSHGSPGCLYLGNTNLSLDTLETYQHDLKTWFTQSPHLPTSPTPHLPTSLSPQLPTSPSPHLPISPTPHLPTSLSPQLLLYGCNVAAGDAGEEFIAKLHKITGAEIAASTTPVGNSAKGGNWELDATSNHQKTFSPFSAIAKQSYSGILANETVDNSNTESIAAGGSSTKTFNITEDLNISDVTLGLNAEHTWRGDIEVILTSPQGTSVTLINADAGDSFDDFDLLLQDGSANSFRSGVDEDTAAPIYDADLIAAPSNPFSAFAGESSIGNWTLTLNNTNVSGENRTLSYNSSQLNIEGTPNTGTPNTGTPGEISGSVFLDADTDGTDDGFHENSLKGIVVTATDASGNTVTTTTAIDGTYSIASSSGSPSALSGEVRLEFALPSDGSLDYLSPTSTGGVDVHFVDLDTSPTVDIGFSEPDTYAVDSNLRYAVSCYVSGNPQHDSNANDAAIATFLYTDRSERASTSKVAATLVKDVGSVWGLANDGETGNVYMSSVLKRHMGLGPDGIGAIYLDTDMSSSDSDNVSLFYDFGALAGNDLNTTSQDVYNNDIRFPGGTTSSSSEGNSTYGSIDADVYSLIGQRGLGGTDLAEDGSELYTINLNDRKLYSINTSGTIATRTATEIPDAPWLDEATWDIVPENADGSESGVARPWAVKAFRGKIYVGVVTDGSNSDGSITGANDHLTAHVFAYDGTSWESVLASPIILDYRRESHAVSANNGPSDDYWHPWNNNYDDIESQIAGKENRQYPQPILGDIEFTNDGSMTLALLDRSAFQFGYLNADPNDASATATSEQYFSQGDLLRVQNNDGTYNLENNGTVTDSETGNTLTGSGANPGGPGGGEFYNDIWSYSNFNLDADTGTGGIVVNPTAAEVLYATSDTFEFYSGGVIGLSTEDGSEQGGVTVYDDDGNASGGTPAKSGGLGDIELLNSTAPLEIGNRIWNDTNADGIQDPGEAAIQGVTINLYNAAGDTLLGTTTTNADGEYYFNESNVNQNGATGLEPNTPYQIQIDSSSANLNGFSLTPANSGSNDSIDSDAVDNAGTPTISVTTGDYGENDYTLDAGFTTTYSISGTVYNDTNNPSADIIEATDTPIEGVTVEIFESRGSKPPLPTPKATTITDENGFYEFTDLPNGNYIVVQTQPGAYDSVTDFDGTDDNQIAVTINDANVTGQDFLEEIPPLTSSDYGDAPDSYETTAVNNGANHPIVTDLSIGDTVDSDDGTQTNAAADADGADEDGVTFTNGTTIDKNDSSYSVDVIVNSPGGVSNTTVASDTFDTNGSYGGGTGWNSNWVESDGNGASNGNVQVRNNELEIRNNDESAARELTLPTGATNVVLSFDYTRVGGLNSGDDLKVEVSNDGVAFTEVREITFDGNPASDTVTINLDGIANNSGGATTIRFNTNDLSGVSANDGYDLDNINITGDVGSATDVTLVSWIDFNRDGNFDTNEKVVKSTTDAVDPLVADGVTPNTIGWTGFSDDITSNGDTYARFRLSTDAASIQNPNGVATDGEVEDYQLSLTGIENDYGDAPDSLPGAVSAADNLANNTNDLPDYETTEADAGANHTQDANNIITIGDTVDEDNGTQQNADATADGADEDGVVVSGTSTSLNGQDIDIAAGGTYSVDVTVESTATNPPTPATGITSTVSGTVFNDYDSDGDFDGTQTITFENGSTTTSTEGGLEGVTVTAYDNGGNVVGTATTDANGQYTINNPTGEALRVEFTNLPGGYNRTSDSSVFVDGSNSTVDLGVLQDNQYVDSNSAPRLFTTCFVRGDSPNLENEAALVSVLHTNQGQSPGDKQTEVTYDQVGTVYGLAYSKQTQDIFLGSFQRRHTDLGPGGNDAIYRVDDNGNVNTLVELDTYFGGTDIAGAYSHGDIGVHDEENRPTQFNDWIQDELGFAATTKVGFGDVEISADGEYVWTINLADRKLYKIEVGDGSTYVAEASESRTIEDFDIVNNLPELVQGSRANAGDVIEDLRPFALSEHNGRIYIGLVDSAQGTQNTDDLHAYVYSFDPTAATPSYTQELAFALDYERQGKSNVHSNANWQPWVDNFEDLSVDLDGEPDDNDPPSPWVSTTQPILSDIEFDNNGDIIVGFRDRTADQIGPATPDTNGNSYSNGKLYTITSGGDILKGIWDSGTNSWSIESGATDTDPDTEFYGGEVYQSHEETAQGALVQIPGYDSVETIALDPLDFSTGGIIGLDNTDGSQTRGIEIVENNFHKANGLGDLEAFSEVAPIEIGNRIWNDLDNDGIQDAGEVGIAGVTVSLYSNDGTLVGTTTTDSNGEYYFNNSNVNQSGATGLSPNASYEIRLDNTADFTGGGALDGFNLVVEDANGNADDNIDSDAIDNAETPTIAVTTGNYGENNYSYDVGFHESINTDVTLVGWIDFDRSGTFDPDEAVTIDTSNGLNTDGTTNTLDFTVPADVEPGQTAARFRVSSGLAGDNLDGTTSTGAAPNGEVEDYIVNLVATYKLSGTVLEDVEDDDTFGAGDTPISGVTVEIFTDDGSGNATGSAIASTTTDASGFYEFTDLPNGNYVVIETQPTGFNSVTDIDGGINNQIITSINDANSTGNDFLEQEVTETFSLGNRVWQDADNNGQINNIETGIDGVVVNLYQDNNNDGNPDGAAIGTETTANGGYYRFDNLAAGDYIAEVEASNFETGNALEGLASSSTDEVEPDDDIESNDNGIGITPDAANGIRSNTVTLGAGFSEPTGETDIDPTFPTSITTTQTDTVGVTPTSRVFIDAVDAEGRHRLTEEANFANRFVVDITGYGENFTGFCIEFAEFVKANRTYTPVNAVNAGPFFNSSYNDPDDIPNFFGVDPNADDYGIVTQAELDTISTVWANVEEDIFTDPDTDQALQLLIWEIQNDQTFDLTSGNFILDDTGSTDPTVNANTTNAINMINGWIDSVNNGTFTGSLPLAMLSIEGDQDIIVNLDLGVGATDSQSNLTVDFGFAEETSLYSLSGTVLEDVEDDDTFGAGDTPISGVTVEIFTDDGSGNTTGNAIASTTTNADGFYEFTDLPNGDYVVIQNQPGAYDSVTDIDGTDDNQIAVTIADADVTDRDFLEEGRYDYGDAPDTLSGGIDGATTGDLPDYQTTEADGGASHTLDKDCPITIGDTVDEDDGTQQNATADADGADEDGVFVAGTNDSLADADINAISGSTYSLDVRVNQSPQAPTGEASTVTGTVFNDYDADGNNDGTQTITFDDVSTTTSTEGGLAGITVTAYDNGGNQVDSTTTDASGAYTLNNPNGDPLRVEFTNIPDGLVANSQGDVDAVDTVFFTDGNDATANLGLLHPENYVDSGSTPTLLTTCFVIGGLDETDTALVSVLHTEQGQTPETNSIVTVNQVGAVYGLAHDKETKDIFLGAFQKRHSDIGPSGNDAIYRVAEDGTVNTLVELDTYFGTTDIAGAYAHGDGGTEANRPTTEDEWLADKDAFATTTKAGFGDVEISGDGEHLWTINLADRKIYKIEVGDGSTYDAEGVDSRTIESYDIINNLTGLVQGSRASVDDAIQDLRPFALAERNGKVYVGLVDSAQSTQDASDLRAYVYSFDPTAATPSFTKELDFALDYERQSKTLIENPISAFPDGTEVGANWTPWADNFGTVNGTAPNSVNFVEDRRSSYSSFFAEQTQPILSDIDFDNDGNIILGFRDRTADQLGSLTPDLDGNFPSVDVPSDNHLGYNVASGGDILKASWDGSQWAIEPTAQDSDPDTEFFGGEAYSRTFPTLDDAGAAHHETAQGGLVQIPGYDSVETTALDPNDFNSGGIIGLDNTDGTQTRGLQLFRDGLLKANGLGDLEYAGEVAPISIGNRLWIDINQDGIQDAGEVGISDVTVSLYNEDGSSLLGTTTTDDKGEYYFSQDNISGGLTPNTTYQIRLSTAADFAADGALDNLNLTVENANGNNSDTLDSDAIDVGGTPTITVTTGDYGENDYTNDIGFTKDVTLVGWIDFDRSGTFDADESVTIDTSNGLNTDGTNTLDFTVPADVEPGETVARFRVASGLEGDNLSAITPNGAAPNGEVEDYVVNLITSTYSLSGTVLEDVEDDDTFGAGDTPISGVTVEIFTDDGSGNTTGNAIASTTTNADGFYEFTDLPNGDYVVIQNQPDGYDSVTDIDGGEDNKILATIADANVTGRDFLEETPPSKITGLVWNDPGFEGIQDLDEVGVDGVTVNLYLQNDPNTPVATTTTSNDGTYEFIVAPDDYFVQFIAPENNVFSLSNTGNDDTVDSDANRATGITENITLSAGETIELDAGISPDSDGDSIPDVVEGTTGDRDNDGTPDFLDIDPAGYFYEQNTGEVIPGGLVNVAGPGAVNLTEDGSADGFYAWFIDGTPGIYTMEITPPEGYIISPDHLPQTPALDPTGFTPDPFEMGESRNDATGALFDFSEANNPYYLQFDLAPNDPFVINNNIPFVAPPTLDLDSNNSGAVDPDSQSAFVVGSGGVAIAFDPIIEDLDATTINSATITLTARPDGDANESLNINGTLPSGITASPYVPGTGVLALSGSASLADYQTAIAQIEYNNTAVTDTSDRTIDVVINDGDFDSNTATSTITIFNQELDFGDAPDSYETTAVNNGASHPIVTDISIGDTVDGDNGTQTNVAADADGADEDGVTFTDGTTIDKSDSSYSVDVIINAPGDVTSTLASDDFSQANNIAGDGLSAYQGGTGWAGDWVAYETIDTTTVDADADAGKVRVNETSDTLEITDNGRAAERKIDLSSTTGDIALNFNYEEFEGGGAIDPGEDPLEIWISNDDGANFTRVESYTATATSPTSIALDITSDITRSADTIIRFRIEPTQLDSERGYSIFDVNLTENTSTEATLVSWIDFNRDGNFDTNEKVVKSTTDAVDPLVADGTTPNTIGWTGFSDDITSNGDTYARFRLSTDAASIQNPNGVATDGEVEDYQLSLTGVESDYGDAPDSLPGALSAADNLANNSNDIPDYETKEAEGGASHTQDPNNIITIGDTVDGDDGTQENATATADDTDTEGDDEDGVVVNGTTNSLDNADIPAVSGSTYSVDVKVNQSISNIPIITPGATRTVSGQVFLDYDNDGVNDGTTTIAFGDGSSTTTSETGIDATGIIVTAYANDGTELDTTTTDATGNYSLDIDQPARIEFSNIPDGYTASSQGNAAADTVSDVFFVDGTSNVNANFGIINDYVDSSTTPALITACYVVGSYFNNSDTAVVSVLHTDQGRTPNNKLNEITVADVGAVNGLAYNPETGDLFAGAFQKRHSDMGPSGNGAIYRITNTDNRVDTSPTDGIDDDNGVDTFIDLNQFFSGETNTAGAYSHGDGQTQQDSINGSINWNLDKDAFATVGKVALGDVEISGDRKHLWTINLADRQLYKIELGDGSDYIYDGTETRAVERYDILAGINGTLELGESGTRTTQTEVESDIRPFALGEKDGLIYVGMVDSAQSTQSQDDLHAYVYTFDPSNGSFTKVLDFDLDYDRQRTIFAGGGNPNADWEPWVDSDDDIVAIQQPDTSIAWPETTQPILSDIEFDKDGSLILGFRDRTADQLGPGDIGTDGNGPSNPEAGTANLIFSASGGDILRATPNGSSWTIESGATDTDPDTEFYDGDVFESHEETAQGGLTQIPGYDSVETIAMDPNERNTGGIRGLDNTTGDETRSLELFVDGFSKGNGLGDLEAITTLAPIEIGNRIWNDLDNDGIQDAAEVGIAGVTVSLYSNITLVGTTTTDSNGEYYFNNSNVNQSGATGLAPNANYEIRLDNTADFTGGGALDGFNLVVEDANSNADDNIDSDAVDNAGTPTIPVTTGDYGENDYSYDVGFNPDVTLVGWIDFDRSGTFDENEAVTIDTNNGLNTDGTTNTLDFTVPGDVEPGETAARFRVASGLAEHNLSATTPTGAAPNGEVEDYIVNLVAPNEPPIIDLDGDDSSNLTGNDYQTTYLVDDNPTPVAIADVDVLINDPDDTNLESASIKLAVRADGDAAESLIVNGTLPSGITDSAYDPVTGILELNGDAPISDYQTAIAQIEYTNSIGYHASDRLVEVTVNDGIFNSNTAITTIELDFLPSIDLDGDDSSFT